MTSLRDLGELRLIARLGSRLGTRLDDDVAVRPEPDGSATVATCDSFLEGVHFDLGWMSPEDVGWRVCALTLADLAAKGAEPSFGLVALSAPAEAGVDTVERIYAGLAECAREFRLELVGGDTSAGPVIALTLFALGRAPEPPLPRSAARPGWVLGVTGPLGGEAAALAEHRPTRPRPTWWRQGGAVGDISDGLLREIAKYGLGAEIESARVPIAEGATLEQALTGGEEVQLVVAAPEPLPGVIPVGRFADGPRILLDGEEVSGGHDHFA